MKIINKKGKKEFTSTFFHSKKSEKEFKRYYHFFTFLLGFLFFITVLIIFTVLKNFIASMIVILVLGFVLYKFKDEYISALVEKVINYSNSNYSKKDEVTTKYMASKRDPTKKKAIDKLTSKKSLISKVFSKKEKKLSDDSYIEIK